jgi:hypothetical protein
MVQRSFFNRRSFVAAAEIVRVPGGLIAEGKSVRMKLCSPSSSKTSIPARVKVKISLRERLSASQRIAMPLSGHSSVEGNHKK